MDTPSNPKNQFEERFFKLDEISRPVRNQRLIEARITFGLACLLIVLGVGLVFWSALQSPAEVKIAKAALGVMMSVGGGTLLKLHKSAHDQLIKDQDDREMRTMIALISDTEKRDQAILDYLADHKRKSLWKRLFG
jgi:hypothetical protein